MLLPYGRTRFRWGPLYVVEHGRGVDGAGRSARRRSPQALDAARGQPGAVGDARPEGGAAARARDSRPPSRRGPQHGRAAERETGDVELEASAGAITPGKRVRYRSAKASPARSCRPASRSSCRASAASRCSCNRAADRPELPDQELTYISAPIALDGRTVGAVGIDLRFKADRDYNRTVEVPRRRRVDDRAGGQGAPADRGRPAAAGRREHAPAAGAEGALRLLEPRRHQRADAAGLRADRAGGAHQHDGAAARRVGHRQGADRARHPLQLAARQEAVHQGELRGAAARSDRVGAVRLREGRVHRRARARRRGASSWPRAARCSSTRSAS